MRSETLRSDAVKTEAVLWENGSRALWKLKGGNDRTALALQGMSGFKAFCCAQMIVKCAVAGEFKSE